MQGYPDTTEEASDLPEVFKINQAGLPVKVFLLRQKLYRKSQQEAELPKIAEDRYRGSRMQETCPSGLMRGDSTYVTTARPRPRG